MTYTVGIQRAAWGWCWAVQGHDSMGATLLANGVELDKGAAYDAAMRALAKFEVGVES